MPTEMDIIDPVDAHVGARMREERINAGVTQAELGTAIGVTFQQIQKYEKGANRISASMIVRVAKTLGVPLMSLFPEDDLSPGRSDPLGTVKGARRLLDHFVAMSAEQREVLVAVAAQIAPKPRARGAAKNGPRSIASLRRK